MTTTLEASTFQKRPAYKYLRGTDKLPTIADLRDDDQAIARVKLFDPTGSWTWYIAAYDPDTRQAYGIVAGHETEEGYIDMAELVAFRGGFGLPIERDLYWTPRTFAAIREDGR